MSIHRPVKLTVGPNLLEIDVYDRYAISLSMLKAGNAWTFAFWRSQTRRATWDVLTNRETGVKVGHIATLSIDGDAVLMGAVETRDVQADREQGARLVISGRDFAAPAMKADADPATALRGMGLGDAITALFAQASIAVQISEHVDPSATVGAVHAPRRGHVRRVTRAQRLDLAHPRPGETVWAVCSRLARKAGYMIWPAPAPATDYTGLVVDVPNYTGERLYRFTREERGETVTAESNILSGGERTSIAEVPTGVTVFGSGIRGDAQAGRHRHYVENAALVDAAIHKGRVSSTLYPAPKYLHSQHSRSPADAAQEARRLLADANRDLRAVTYTVQGHGGYTGPIYGINRMATVNDDTADVHEDMLITELTFRGDRAGGQVTEVTLSPDGAIQLLPES